MARMYKKAKKVRNCDFCKKTFRANSMADLRMKLIAHVLATHGQQGEDESAKINHSELEQIADILAPE